MRTRAWRIGTLGAVVAAAVAMWPGTSGAATWKGVVVAKDAGRSALVTASPGGVVRTVRAPARLRAIRVGQRVAVNASRLADGTFRAASVGVTGRAKRAVIRGVLVRRQAGRYLVSAGGTVVAVRAARSRLRSSDDEQPGDRLLIQARISGGAMTATSVHTVGQAGMLELEGIYLGTTGSVLRLAVARRGEVPVTIPTGMTLPTLAAGDVLELAVTVDAAGAFTLVNLQFDDHGHHGDDDHGLDLDDSDGELEVRGTIAALSATSISIQPGSNATPLVCTIPTGISAGAFKVGDVVEMKCRLLAGVWTLARLETEDDDDDDDELEATGPITAISATSVTVTPKSGSAVTCRVPTGVDVSRFTVGQTVEIECDMVAGAPVLKHMHLEDGDEDEDHHEGESGRSGDDD